MTTISRDTAVSRIRERLIAMSEPGKSMCQIAAERKVLCRGFDRESEEALRWRYAEKIPVTPYVPIHEVRTLANTWQLGRQIEENAHLCCDVQYRFYETCRAWDDFTNDELAQYCFELTGEKVTVFGEVSRPVL